MDTSWKKGNGVALPFNFAFFSYLWSSQIRLCTGIDRIGYG